jgi:type VI secretion system protein ImpE
LEALKFDAANDGERANAARKQALEQAPSCAGSINGERFEWLADADARLGPVIEAVINGRYFWVPLQRVQRIEFDAPVDLRDAVWTPATFTWTNGAHTVGLIPTRYNHTLATGDDSLLLARRTEWVESSACSGYGLGQRMLATDTGDYALMDVRVIEFDAIPGCDLTADVVHHG